MAQHSFAVGDKVEFLRNRLGMMPPPGQFVITRLLPNDGMDREYRVQHVTDGHQRIVRESELRRGSQPLG